MDGMDNNLECCVSECLTRPNQGLHFYRFPCHNPKISSIWEHRICHSANIDFLNDYVCELHFDYRCKTGNDCALEEGSLPTLHLPCFRIPFTTGDAHFQIGAKKIELSYTISIDDLSYHCRFCLRRGLLYEVESSTYRSKSFQALIDLPPNVMSDNAQPNACLSCLKSIVISHQLSMAAEHSNTNLQLLLQHPKQSKVVSNTNFFDVKSELTFCNLILANSLSIKLEIEFEDNMICANEDYERKWVSTEELISSTAHFNSQNMVEKSICITENHDNASQMHDSITSDEQCPKEFDKHAIGAVGDNTTALRVEEIPNANENSDSCVLMENTDECAAFLVSNNSDVSCAEDREFDNEQSPESTSEAVNDPTWQTAFTTIDKNIHWNKNDDVYVCPTYDWKNPSFHTFNVHIGKHMQSHENISIGLQELETLVTDPVRNAGGRYQCSKCPKTFNDKSHFNVHKRIHTNERPYNCTECPKTFSKKCNFDRHKIIHTNERPYKCTECPKTFSDKSHFNVHKRLHTNERPYKCTECPKTFSDKSNFAKHKRKHANERPYKCTECQKTFSEKSHFNVHSRIHTNERPYKCMECPTSISQKGNLGTHKRMHTNERPYNCTECPKSFSLKCNLDRHNSIHTNERPYNCTECPKTFNQKGSFNKHKKIHTNERPYKCTECPKAFSDKSHFTVHRRIHTKERPYKCPECPTTFSQKGNLDTHRRMHTNERPYKCTECSTTFSQKGNLDAHKRMHTNERPYKCTECPKTFSQKSHFSVHKRIHTNERPYKCNECPKTFSQKSNFSVHKRIHTNERPYKCTECPKTFSQNSHFSVHQRIHTKERPYKCTECPKTFNRKDNCDLHKMIHTNTHDHINVPNAHLHL